jgi:hypothetical protein
MPKHRARACRGSRHSLGYWKENFSSKINISGLGCGRAVRDRIAPAIDDVLSLAAGSEKVNTPHQSAPVEMLFCFPSPPWGNASVYEKK